MLDIKMSKTEQGEDFGKVSVRDEDGDNPA